MNLSLQVLWTLDLWKVRRAFYKYVLLLNKKLTFRLMSKGECQAFIVNTMRRWRSGFGVSGEAHNKEKRASKTNPVQEEYLTIVQCYRQSSHYRLCTSRDAGAHHPYKPKNTAIPMADTRPSVLKLAMLAPLFLLNPNGRPCVLNVTFCWTVLFTH